MRKSIMLLLVLLVSFLVSSCDLTKSAQEIEQEKVAKNMSKMENQTPVPVLNNSLERKNIAKRLTLFEDENKVSYIYLISFGKVMAFYVVKGKVSSGSKRLTSTQKVTRTNIGGSYSDNVMEQAELDGTYGSSSEYIYFWTTGGQYIQWNDKYMLCDAPLKMTTQPELVKTVN